MTGTDNTLKPDVEIDGF